MRKSLCCCIVGRASLLLALACVIAPLHLMADPAADPNEVWVSDSEGDNETGNGTEGNPYKTIQKGISEVAKNGTVKIKAGVYDEGETYAGSHSNRVNLTKKVTLEGVEGKDVTHIVGAKDGSTTYGLGTAAVRPVRVAAAAYGSILKNLTIRDGASRSGSNSAYAYGGGVMVESVSYYSRVGAYLVDCVVSNCVGEMGGGVYGITAVRCLIANNKSTGWGSGAVYCNLLNSLLTGNQCVGSSARGAVTDSLSVNCTVARNRGSKARGFDKRFYQNVPTAQPQKIYNCVSFENSNSDIASAGSCTVSNTYTTSTSASLLYDAVNGDFRLSPGTPAVGGGLTEFLSLISLPEGISAYKDYAGNDIDPESETCDAGCIQGAVVENEKVVTITAANGGITVTGAVIGENTIAVGNTVTITSGPGTRPCTGVKVNGVTYLFDDTPTVEVAITTALPSSSTISAIYTKHWYVDANAANDDGTGFRPGDPMKTLTNALAHAVSGDTVHAAPGRYEEGQTAVSGSRSCRAAVPEGVTLVADEGPDCTFIIGAPATDPLDSYGLGLGTNAVSCVRVAKNGHVRGFTLTGGHTDYTTSTDGISDVRYSGGGACGIAESTCEYQFVEDCIISNNFASYGGAGRVVTLVRCRVFDNKALNNGGGIVMSHAYGTLFDRNRQGESTSEATCRNITKLVGCTITPANLTLSGTTTNYAISAVTSSAGQFHGCLILGSVNDGGRTKFDAPSTYCVFSGSRDGFPTNEGCVVVSSSVAKKILDKDFRPAFFDGNPAVDGWDAASLASKYGSVSRDFDLSGETRILNGRPDIGALESDPKPLFAKVLDGKGRYLAVTEADVGVTNIANGVTLQDGMSLSLVWSCPVAGAPRFGHVSVTGEGTLTATKDGAPFATYTSEDGEVEFDFAPEGRSAELVFSFAGEGSADIYSFKVPLGVLLMVK